MLRVFYTNTHEATKRFSNTQIIHYTVPTALLEAVDLLISNCAQIKKWHIVAVGDVEDLKRNF